MAALRQLEWQHQKILGGPRLGLPGLGAAQGGERNPDALPPRTALARRENFLREQIAASAPAAEYSKCV